MLEWVLLIAILFFTGWMLKAFFATPFVLAPTATAAPPTSKDPRAYRPESWCFVGENTLGRFCVQSDRCGPLDRFPSKDACEYTEASALPLGTAEEGGLYYRPFMTPRNIRYNTF